MLVGAMTFTAAPLAAFADEAGEWREEDGSLYWYEYGVKQGTEGRGKEIYDPASDAWYWLDAIDGGRKATSKDVYQESLAGEWGDATNEAGEKIGKWVRYDADGHMVKGWQTNEAGTYYFDPVYGTMAKGNATIDGTAYYFDTTTGILQNNAPVENGWWSENGKDYWYENGVRQGYDPDNADYRGKEIYDPASDAWYWLDNVQQGAKTVSKDVYQESLAGEWGEATNEAGERIGKWVRYDANGHMVKGWDEQNGSTYYFDPMYGTMCKGLATIDGATYYFDPTMGTMVKNTTVTVGNTTYTFGEDGRATRTQEEGSGSCRKEIRFDNTGTVTGESYYDEHGSMTKHISYDADGNVSWIDRYAYEYDAQGNKIKRTRYNKDDSSYSYEYGLIGDIVTRYSEYDADGNRTSDVSVDWNCEYDEEGRLIKYEGQQYDGPYIKGELEYTGKGIAPRRTEYVADGRIYRRYDEYGNCTEEVQYTSDGEVANINGISNEADWFRYEYTYDDAGKVTKMITIRCYADGTPCVESDDNSHRGTFNYIYNEKGQLIQEVGYRQYLRNVSLDYYNYIYEYDSAGKLTKKICYSGKNEQRAELQYTQIYTYDN